MSFPLLQNHSCLFTLYLLLLLLLLTLSISLLLSLSLPPHPRYEQDDDQLRRRRCRVISNGFFPIKPLCVILIFLFCSRFLAFLIKNQLMGLTKRSRMDHSKVSAGVAKLFRKTRFGRGFVGIDDSASRFTFPFPVPYPSPFPVGGNYGPNREWLNNFKVITDEIPDNLKLPISFNQLVSEMKIKKYIAKDFTLILKGMMETSEREIRKSKFAELMNKHFAASAVPKGIYCLAPEKIVFHIITGTRTYASMHSWFALNPVLTIIAEGKGIHQFDWLTRENVHVLEAVERDYGIRNYYHGNRIAGANLSETTFMLFASKLQARSPKYISLINHLRISFPELFPNLNKVVFLDDDVVVQRDLSHLWEIDLDGKVNGDVETYKGEDEWVMSKRFRNYFNFSHPLISNNVNPDECAWAYGMNIINLIS